MTIETIRQFTNDDGTFAVTVHLDSKVIGISTDNHAELFLDEEEAQQIAGLMQQATTELRELKQPPLHQQIFRESMRP